MTGGLRLKTIAKTKKTIKLQQRKQNHSQKTKTAIKRNHDLEAKLSHNCYTKKKIPHFEKNWLTCGDLHGYEQAQVTKQIKTPWHKTRETQTN